MNLNTNRSSPPRSTNGVSSFSGKTRPSVTEGTVEVLTSLMQELQSNGKTDSELWKNCETRWLQLFNLVEKQCEEQIVAQQEQFHTQIQRIQEEIKNLVKLQTNNASWTACDSSLSKHIPAESPMGFFLETNERNEAAAACPQSNTPEMQQEARTSQPDCSADGSSVSSGYGTFCTSELNTCKCKDPGPLLGPEAESAGPCGAPAGQAEPRGSCADRVIASCPQTAGSFSESSLFPGELELDFLGRSKISEVYSGKKNSSKAITSWAQKLKQNQPKRVHAEEGCSAALQAGELAGDWPSEKSDLTAATQPGAFYLSKSEEVPDSWMSDSGTAPELLYWKLEEDDTYHSLPETFDRSLVPPPAPCPSQFNASNEMRPPSLKDIYHKKQRENKRFPENPTSDSHPDHPPEVLAPDPAAHRKPHPHPAAPRPQGFHSALDLVSSSPDSVPGPTLSRHSDTDSFSQASHVTPQLSGVPKSPSSKALPRDPWENHTFQNASRASSTFASVYTTTSSDVSVNTMDGDSVPGPAAASSGPECGSSASPGHPVFMSQVRQNLKEKHARHIADLRAYYESEINSLKQKLETKEICAVENWKKANQILIDRCGQLDSALSEATSRVRTLENENNLLEIEVSDLRDRFSAASNASRVLQERLEEMRASNKEKDGTIVRMKGRLQAVEEALENAYKLSDSKDARLKEESRMFRDLLSEYESLGKEHEQVKETLNTAENKLLDAHTQISDLKRTVSKLEAQVKQVEHENLQGLRRHFRAPTRPSRADTLPTSDVSRRKWLIPGAEYSIFTGQPLALQDRRGENPLEKTCVPGDAPPRSPPGSPLTADPRDTSDAPIMKALQQLEEEKILKNLGTQTEETSDKSITSCLTATSVSGSRSPEKCTQQRQKRFNSASQRSSSLPPSNRRSSAPTKRDIMLTPVTATYSPKRSPKENLSPGFSHLLSKNENSSIQSDILLDDLDAAPAATAPHASPRRQLQFPPAGVEEKQHSDPAARAPSPACRPLPEPWPGAVKQRGSGEGQQEAGPGHALPAAATPQDDFEYTAKIRTLAETERFFDELTKEKDQIEAALSRMPSTGGRVTLQTRLNQEALEERLERVTRELGSVRMTLKKFHVLRTCTNL